MEKQSVYKKQMKLSGIQFLLELPSFLAITVSAVLSGSLIVWLDFMESLGSAVSEGMVVLLSKKMSRDLRYEYNYGIGKIEAMTALFYDGIELLGLMLIIACSFFELFNVRQPSKVLIYVVILKVVNIVVDLFFIWQQYKLKKENNNLVVDSKYMSVFGALLFDIAALVSLLIVWIFRNNPFSWFLSPLLGLVISVYLLIRCVWRVREAMIALSDKTLPEEEQMKILRVLARHNEEYSDFNGVKSHYSGEDVCIDLCISFLPQTSYDEIKAFLDAVQRELSQEIENCMVTIIIE